MHKKAILYFIVWMLWGFGVFLITRSNQEEANVAAYNRGYEHGYEDGLKDGYLEGEKDTIENATSSDVNPEIKYPYNQYSWGNTVIIFLDYSDTHYHQDAKCSWLSDLDAPNAIVVSEYEAVERNFEPCPNCCKTHF